LIDTPALRRGNIDLGLAARDVAQSRLVPAIAQSKRSTVS
jgi:hypothetical protein